MSVRNKAIDRGKNGKIKRKYTGPWGTGWNNHTPGWWVNLYMNRPKRRANKYICHLILQGEDPDSLAFPLGNHKPHRYYT